MKVTRLLFRQARPRVWLGGLRVMIQRTQSYYSLLNIVLLLITTYTVREATIKHYIPGFNFLWLLGIGAAAVVLIALLDYKVIHPSEIAYAQHEAWKHRSPVRRELAQLREEIGRLQEKSITQKDIGKINRRIREGMTWRTSSAR